MNKLLKIIGPVLVIALGAGAFVLLQVAKPEPEKRVEPPRGVSVFVRPVQERSIDLDIVTQGEVRPKIAIDIVSQVGGRVTQVSGEFVEGGVVEPEVPLILIEDTDYRLALSDAEARVAEADVGVQQALADADVARKQLAGQKDASPLALKIPQVGEARARLKAASANLEQARVNLDRTRISLPFRGRVTETLVDMGQYVVPGARLGRAFANDTVEIRLPLTDAQLASLDLPIGYQAPDGNGPRVHLSAVVAGVEQHWEGQLARLDAVIDPATRMVYGTAEVRDPYNASVSEHGMPLAVGLYVTARIEGREMAHARVIPRDALRAGDKVYVVNSDNRLEIRHVDVTHASERQAVIGAGLSAGERVVVSSIRNPIEGMALESLDAPEPETEHAVTGNGADSGMYLPAERQATAGISDTSREAETPAPTVSEG